ncbi:MAG: DEAD/DEAH box helicase [Sandaracinaceae bacterium]|nr:DEAD/DEAH box helicase [Sandaracinaceae bacterium]
MKDELASRLPEPVRKALEAKGFETLTEVQRAVLQEGSQGRDLRISSQTGSGKTIAFAFVLLPELADPNPGRKIRALVITPTRELATQVAGELAWVLAPMKLRVLAATGGTSVREEARALSKGADVLVGTPGRLVDHLERTNFDASEVKAVVLDEADQMLDLGFREALETILKALPKERRSHLVSATFSREVLTLAARYQHNALSIEGTRLGANNTDISHHVYLVQSKDRARAVMNMLLLHPGESTLIFVRMRADAARLTEILNTEGFAAAALSGDLAQGERTRTLASFRSGKLKVLVATDVAARGIDVEGITRVIHGDPPTNVESYTHRSGRTGRAGKKGESIMLVTPDAVNRAKMLLRRAKIEPEVRGAPNAREVQAVLDQRRLEDLIKEAEAAASPDAQREKLVGDLLARAPAEGLVRALLARLDASEPHTPFPITEMSGPRDRGNDDRFRDKPMRDARPPFERKDKFPSRDDRDERPQHSRDAAPRDATPRERTKYGDRPREGKPEQARPEKARDAAAHERKHADKPREHVRAEKAEHARPEKVRDVRPEKTRDAVKADRPARGDAPAPRAERPSRGGEAPPTRTHARDDARPARSYDRDDARPTPVRGRDEQRFTAFTINWGARHGADARRLMALVCRRGDIRGTDVGAIRIDPMESFFEVASHLAPAFTRAAARRDARDPGLRISALKAPRAKPARNRTETR